MPLPFQIIYILNIITAIFFVGYKILFSKEQMKKLLFFISLLGIFTIVISNFITREINVLIFLIVLFILFYYFIRNILLTALLFMVIYMFNFAGQTLVIDIIPKFTNTSVFEMPPFTIALLCLVYYTVVLILLYFFYLLQKKTQFYSVFNAAIKKYYTYSICLLIGFYIVNAFHFFFTYDSSAEFIFSLFFIWFYTINGIIIAVFFIKSELNQRKLSNLAIRAKKIKTQAENVQNFKHDYKSLLLSLALYIKNDQKDEALSLIQSESEYFDTQVLESDDDALLNIELAPIQGLLKVFLDKCKEQKIPYKLSIPDKVPNVDMNLIDFIRCFSIVLNNALEASASSHEPQISLDIKTLDDDLVFTVANNVDDSSRIDTSRIVKKNFTTKESHKGRGLFILFKLMNKYENTRISIQAKDNTFIVNLAIRNQSFI
ncbi:GHKL domain-containing protein [Listeria aquatica]|uniref:GHKL domain-containing protein n=1 Tax=Listeria aquatica TaxID=1494960 RepID=A0A841ZIY6_9LIST|nr:GHKL domain-containing protein [Listeria aquatica]MBC1520086.1 GHKL domain-containing protein [Listeria aquatica]